MKLIGWAIENQRGDVLHETDCYDYWDETGGTVFGDMDAAELTLRHHQRKREFDVRIVEVFTRGVQ